MYNDDDLDAAVAAGAIQAEAAAALRAFVARRRAGASPIADEEQFRLLTGFNDIFVSIAALLFLIAVAWLTHELAPPLAGAAVAAMSWGLSEYFTRRRRMALPSIILLGSFVGGVGFEGMLLGAAVASKFSDGAVSAIAASAAMAAAIAHWRHFRVPITVAVGAASAVGAAIMAVLAAVPAAADHWAWLLLAGGLGLFVLAMRWDIGDRARLTRRSDVAFWLHLSASPAIVHPVFSLLGLLEDGETSLARAGVAVGLYGILALVALTIDRRAMLVSALFYVLYAISTLIKAAGALNLGLALTALVVGSALLLLSAFWQAARKRLMPVWPESVRARVPAA